MSDPIHPVILCGGSGTRLWPVSRKARPKPFLPLIGETTLFEEAIKRVSAPGFAAPIVVAGAPHCDLIEAQIAPLAREHRLIVEPCARNTAPAIALAAALLPPDAIMLVCPSDHHIADPAAFRDAARAAARLAAADHLVAFGIAPDRAETGYGYLHRGEPLEGGYRIAQFVEKPDRPTARGYLATGEYSWNGGIFAFRAGTFLAELARHRPDIAKAVLAAVEAGETQGARFHPDAGSFAAIEGDSIDYAVMENTTAAAMVPVDMGWSDIGNWPALAEALATKHGADGQADGPADGNADGPVGPDADGNLARGPADFIDARGVFAFSDGPRISAVGIEDVCIIVCDGEILVTSREGAQKVSWLPGARLQ